MTRQTPPAPSLLHCRMREAQDYQASFHAALKERPDNAAITPTDDGADAHLPSSAGPLQRLMVAFSKHWAPGRTLRIAFLDAAPPSLTLPVIEAARQWLPHVNLQFDFVSEGHSDIRIAFNTHINTSALGTDALLVAQELPTMEFNRNDLYEADDSPRPELARIVLHEFGHALGAVHEHQHPRANIPWNVPLLSATLMQAGYSEAQIRENILDSHEAADFMHSAYDRDSVMHYDIPRTLTLGGFEIDNAGKTLSAGDIRLMGFVYPRQRSATCSGQ